MGLIAKLRRRNVFRMAALYLVSAWLVLQVVDVIGDIVIWPLWTNQLVLVVLALGFPIALVISWFYQVTSAGVRREEEAPTATATGRPHGRAVDFVIISVLCAAVLVFAYDKWWPQATVERSIAVLPFQNLSGDPEQEYFSDGIAEDTLNLLAGFNTFKVIAWTTARTYRDRAVDIASIASELNVSHVLEGSVRKSGNRVRIMAQLIDGTDDSHVWSQSYEREVTAENLFEIQQDIATAIAARLRTSLTEQERGRLEKVPTHDLEAYDAYLLGRQGLSRYTTASLQEAVGHLGRAIELDPMFAEAHVALAEAYWKFSIATFGVWPKDVSEETIEGLIARALELDPELGFAHAMHGRWLAKEGQAAAEAEFQRAIELNPDDPDVWRLYSDFMDVSRLYSDFTDDRERALELMRQALRLDPKSPSLLAAVGMQLLELGRPDDAAVYLKRAIDSDPESFWGYWGLGILNWYFTGHMDEAMRLLRIAYSKDPGNVSNIGLVGWVYLFLTDDVAAERWFRHAMTLTPNDFFGRLGIIDVYHLRGWHEEEWELLAELPNGALRRKLTHLIAERRYQEALERAMLDYPDYFEQGDVRTDFRDRAGLSVLWLLARDTQMVMILDGLGDKERAQELLANMEHYISSRLATVSWENSIYAQVYALLGRKVDAIEFLRKGYAGGSFGWWQFELESPAFHSIRADPEFQQLQKEIEAKMAAQLQHVREMEGSGELPMLPEET